MNTIVRGPGDWRPDFLVEPPTPELGMQVRPSSTVVTSPTLIGDILTEDMGMCNLVACTKPGPGGIRIVVKPP
jgi:hypothetical protein